MKGHPYVLLNLGCGRDTRLGWVNVDRIPGDSVDVVHDLEERPWPFQDALASEILARHVVEHLDDVPAFLSEAWRVLRPGGILEIHYPHPRHPDAWTDPTHRRVLTRRSWDYFTGKRPDWPTYGVPRFDLERGPWSVLPSRWVMGRWMPWPGWPEQRVRLRRPV